jgi:hypothetical protein
MRSHVFPGGHVGRVVRSYGGAAAGLVVLVALMLPASAFAAAAGINITATEGAGFTQRVADIEGCVFTSATVNWGDGSSSAGQFETGDPPHVKGTHTYAEEGTFNGSVDYVTQCTSNGHVTFTATVADAALTAAGHNISPNAGQSFTGIVSHFTDADPAGQASDYTATIKWGDGTATSSGTVSAAPGGGFDVTGTHTYSSTGQSAVNVTVNDNPATAQSSSTATIVPPPPPLYAKFTYTPASPCRDQTVNFDASASGGSPISYYRWDIVLLPSDVPSVATTDPKFRLDNGFPLSGVNPFDPSSTGLTHGLRPPADVTLTVRTADGHTATTTQTITFRNPDELGYAVYGYIGIPKFGGFFLEGFTTSAMGPCQGYIFNPFRANVTGALTAGVSTLTGGDLSVPVACGAHMPCAGTLVVAGVGNHLVATKKHRKLYVVHPLGYVKLSLRAGGKKTAHIHLNTSGRDAARAGRLKRVNIALVTKNSHVVEWVSVHVKKRTKKKH